MQPTDRNGHPPSSYPETHLDGDFLGVNGDGIGEYYSGNHVFLAERTASGLKVPPPGYGIAHEFYLEDMTLAEYIVATTEESGRWIYLTELSKQELRESGRDPVEYVD